jgi:hypothetical protein
MGIATETSPSKDGLACAPAIAASNGWEAAVTASGSVIAATRSHWLLAADDTFPTIRPPSRGVTSATSITPQSASATR